MDLLIAPMAVTAALNKALPRIRYSQNQVYLTATHSHNSMGGWAKKPAGYLMAGKYDKKIVTRLTQSIIHAIEKAELKAGVAQIGYGNLQAPDLVRNRLLGETGTEDAGIRVLKFRKPSTGETAVLCTYGAHATCLPAAELSLSGDYPTALVQQLEKDKNIDFAAFGAGGVGSHSPAAPGNHFEKIQNMASGLGAIIQNNLHNIPAAYQFDLNSVSVPLYLRRPHWRISENWRLHPGLFYQVFGKYPATLTGLRIGNLLLVGTPCDFSGELVPDLEKQLKPGSDQLVVTSFNGGYIGYITPDKYYNLKKYETRDMNLFGPYNGSYLSEMIGLLLHKL